MRLSVIVLALFIAASASAARVDTVWRITPEDGTRVTEGVSTEAVRWNDGTVRIYLSTMSGERAYTSSDGLAFQPLAANLPKGTDPSLVRLSDGRWRMYYLARSPDGTSVRIMSAVSTDGLAWTDDGGVRLDISGPGKAGGVPEAVQLADGRTRLYYIPFAKGDESIASATSNDGLNFTQDPGSRLTGGYVDPAVVQLSDGSFLGLFSTSPKAQQQLFIGHSADGLTWTVDPKPALDYSANALDPTMLDLGDGTLRVYYSISPAGQQLTGPYTVVSGILKQQALSTPPTTPEAKPKPKPVPKCKKGQKSTKKAPCKK